MQQAYNNGSCFLYLLLYNEYQYNHSPRVITRNMQQSQSIKPIPVYFYVANTTTSQNDKTVLISP